MDPVVQFSSSNIIVVEDQDENIFLKEEKEALIIENRLEQKLKCIFKIQHEISIRLDRLEKLVEELKLRYNKPQKDIAKEHEILKGLTDQDNIIVLSNSALSDVKVKLIEVFDYYLYYFVFQKIKKKNQKIEWALFSKNYNSEEVKKELDCPEVLSDIHQLNDKRNNMVQILEKKDIVANIDHIKYIYNISQDVENYFIPFEESILFVFRSIVGQKFSLCK